jgi:phosphatidate cytidylyltransferase
MNLELKKRIITSIFLLILLSLMFLYNYVLIISLIIISIISWIEFNALITKILLKNNFKNKTLRFIYKAISLLYLSLLSYLIVLSKINNSELFVYIMYAISISIMSDIGGLIFGKFFKGKKLTKISPKKTFSGSMGSFIFSLTVIPFFFDYLVDHDYFSLIVITLVISLVSQVGDLIISLLKRKAKVKNTSDILPGHGGALDRIDGIIFSIPIGFLLLIYF